MANDNEQDTKIAVLETNYKTMAEKIDDLKKTVNKGFTDLKKEFSSLKEDCDDKYVSKDKFEPVRAIAYGMVGIILSAVLLGLVNVILK